MIHNGTRTRFIFFIIFCFATSIVFLHFFFFAGHTTFLQKNVFVFCFSTHKNIHKIFRYARGQQTQQTTIMGKKTKIQVCVFFYKIFFINPLFKSRWPKIRFQGQFFFIPPQMEIVYSSAETSIIKFPPLLCKNTRSPDKDSISSKSSITRSSMSYSAELLAP